MKHRRRSRRRARSNPDHSGAIIAGVAVAGIAGFAYWYYFINKIPTGTTTSTLAGPPRLPPHRA